MIVEIKKQFATVTQVPQGLGKLNPPLLVKPGVPSIKFKT
jgi:hypothetical protein